MNTDHAPEEIGSPIQCQSWAMKSVCRKYGLVLPVRRLCQLEETPADLPGIKCCSLGRGLSLALGGGVGDGRRIYADSSDGSCL